MPSRRLLRIGACACTPLTARQPSARLSSSPYHLGHKAGDYSPQISQTDAGDTSLAWRSGKLILDNLALVDALPLIDRYLSKPVMLADNTTGTIRVGGIYDVKEVKGLVNSQPKVLPVYLTRNKDGNPVLNAIAQQAPKR